MTELYSHPDTPRGNHLAWLAHRAAFAPKGKKNERAAQLQSAIHEELRVAAYRKLEQLPLPIGGQSQC